jgi:hypothetical protein
MPRRCSVCLHLFLSPSLPLDITTAWTGLLVLAGLSPAEIAASLAAPDPYEPNSGIRLSHRVSSRRRTYWTTTYVNNTDPFVILALQLLSLWTSESMGNHDSNVMGGADSVD